MELLNDLDELDGIWMDFGWNLNDLDDLNGFNDLNDLNGNQLEALMEWLGNSLD